MKVASLPLVALLSACAPSLAGTPSRAAVSSVLESDGAAAPKPSAAPPLALTLLTDAHGSGRLHGALTLSDASAESVLRYEPAHAKLLSIAASDGRGPLAIAQTADGTATRIRLARAPEGTLSVAYEVALESTAVGTNFASIAEPTELRVEGRDALLLPEQREPLSITLVLSLAAAKADAASSFGLGAEQRIRARAGELRAATYLAGDLGHAAFQASDGDDFSVWAGYTAFDARWVAAETASVRSAVDDYVGTLPHEKRAAVSFLLLPEKRDRPFASIRLAPRGLVASVDPRAPWTAPLRLRVAQALSQRTIGGRLWVGDRDKPASGHFFSEGFSRAVALEIVSASGIFEHADRAAELNSLLAAIDLSPVGTANATVLAAHPDATEVLRVVTARGALVALSFGVALGEASHGTQSLKSLIRKLLERAGERDTLAFDDLVAVASSLLPQAEVEMRLKSLTAGGEVVVPSGLLGRCYKLTRGPVAPFELGFEVAPSEGGVRITALVAGSAAAKAGLREGELLRELRYEDGRSSIPAIATRADGTKPIRFLPAGKPKNGRRFERVRSVPESDC